MREHYDVVSYHETYKLAAYIVRPTRLTKSVLKSLAQVLYLLYELESISHSKSSVCCPLLDTYWK